MLVEVRIAVVAGTLLPDRVEGAFGAHDRMELPLARERERRAARRQERHEAQEEKHVPDPLVASQQETLAREPGGERRERGRELPRIEHAAARKKTAASPP